MTPTKGTNQQENTLQNVAETIFRPRGEMDNGPDANTNPGKSLLLNPNPKTGTKPFHPDAACAMNVG